jgi:hypothetical protein
MSVYKRGDGEFYTYDFRMDGVRYSGFTGTADVEEARLFEKTIRDEVLAMSSFCRTILRKARRQFPTGAAARRGYVYVIRSGYFIKIGHSQDPAERFRSINTSTPDGCELLFFLPGEMKLERELHSEFAACHYKKEWFFLCGKLKRFIAEFERKNESVTQTATGLPPETPMAEISF